MKKTVCLIMAFALILLAGCNNKKPSSSSGGDKVSSSVTASNDASDKSDSDTESSVSEIPTRREDRVSLQTSSEETIVPIREGYALEDAPAFEKVKLGKYRFVWGDEFDGSSLNYNKWGYGEDQGEKPKVQFATQEDDPSVVGVRNGTLQMNARRYTSLTNPQTEFINCRSVNTQHTMNFKYGYLEMRAKVPHTHGAVSSLWLKNEKIGLVEPKNKDYFVEIDIFESWSSSNQLDPGLHKWYKNNAHTIPNMSQVPGYGKYRFNDYANIRNEYHIYAMEWTPEFIKFYTDGELWCTYDITEPFDKGWKVDNKTGIELPPGAGEEMDGFHDYAYVIMTDILLVDPETHEAEEIINETDELPYEFWVDYVRLYQDPDVDGGIVTKK